MNHITKKPIDRLGYEFVEKQFIPKGQDEYYLRNEQLGTDKKYRTLRAHEIEILVKNENTSDNWNQIGVTDKFNPQFVQGCNFYGKIRIGDLEPFLLEFHDLQHPVGLYNSNIISCDLGDNVVVDNVNHLAYYQIGNECMLLNINEMLTSNHAKFGNGILKEGENESVRIWMELCNENGGRKILPFDSMLAGDAFLWTKYRDDISLMDSFKELVSKQHDKRRGFYGTVGDRTVIKNSKIIKDVKFGPDAYVKGANKLKNLTIDSRPGASTQIGEGCEMVNGIVSHGCRVFYGVKAVRFYMGSYSNLKYGARLINSYLGNNATISCCEVLNSLIYPGHEQHHNNSFLCASRIEGQSNMAAGATIGSNHNSRGNDGEIIAKRGFWPGLCVSLKHNSRFATYNLINKGSYPYEMDIPLPFTLVSNNESENSLHLMPAYWFMYNMYALARNAWKYETRDKRQNIQQFIEYDFLAPDAVNEMFEAMALLEKWAGLALMSETEKLSVDETSLKQAGKEYLTNDNDYADFLPIIASGVENSKREVLVDKAPEAYKWYKKMINHYAVSNVVHYFDRENSVDFERLFKLCSLKIRGTWINVGGQLILEQDLERLKNDVKAKKLATWDNVHQRYAELSEKYPNDKLSHAYLSLLEINGITNEQLPLHWDALLSESVKTQQLLAENTRLSREKDYKNPYRQMSYNTTEEMNAVLGDVKANEFVKLMKEKAKNYEETVKKLRINTVQ